MRLTPRQLMPLLFVARRRRRKLLAEQLSLSRLAAHGDPDAVKRQTRRLEG
jgi:hypothetical protein